MCVNPGKSLTSHVTMEQLLGPAGYWVDYDGGGGCS
jgi:hypothetical protein